MNETCYLRFTSQWMYSFDGTQWHEMPSHNVTMEIGSEVTSVRLEIQNRSGDAIESLRITREGGAYADFLPFPIENAARRDITWDRYLPAAGQSVSWSVGPVPTATSAGVTPMIKVPDPTFTVTRKGG